MKRCLAAFALACALALPAPATLAWNAAGHRLVAAVAWRQMPAEARRGAAALLRQHPDFEKWTAKGDNTPGYAAFLGAATWPDDIRNDRRYHDSDTPPASARHKDWHYVDLAPDGSVRDGQLDRQIGELARDLHSPSLPAEDKAIALAWLIHLVGDIHQPLHVGCRDDEGGNRFEIEDPFNPRLPFTNLHTWWDDQPGPPWLRGKRLDKAADALLAAHPQPPRQGNVALWRAESHQIACAAAYPTSRGSLLPAVSEEFRTDAHAIVDERLTTAGFRLAHLLQGILTGVSRGTD